MYVCSRGRRSNNSLLSKKLQMDLTALILEVLGPRVVDFIQLSFQPRLDEMLWPQTELPLDVALEKCGALWGSGARHWPRPVCLFLGRLQEKSPHCLRSQTMGKKRSGAPTSLSNPDTS